jgi:hypothetical protein
MFTILDDGCVLRKNGGVFIAASLAIQGKKLYAAISKNSFVRLYENHLTSSMLIRWETLQIKYKTDALGRLEIDQ